VFDSKDRCGLSVSGGTPTARLDSNDIRCRRLEEFHMPTSPNVTIETSDTLHLESRSIAFSFSVFDSVVLRRPIVSDVALVRLVCLFVGFVFFYPFAKGNTS
jgi:hypothetical protein